jgi:type I restriction enzyme S subunit
VTWPMVHLRDLTCLADSGTWGDETSEGAGFPVLRSSNIQGGRLDLSEVAWRLIPEADIARRLLQSGDLLVTKSSGSPELIGKCCQFTQPDGATEFYFSNFTLRLRADHNRADSRWLFFWLSSPRGRAALAAMNTTTSGLRNLNIDLYLSQLVPAPSVTDQHRIAAILDKADAIRHKRQQAIETTDDLLRASFLEMFGDPVTNPRQWPTVSLGQLGAITTGNTPPRSMPEFYGDNIEWITSDNINTPNHFLTRAGEGLSDLGRTVARIVPAGSVLVTCIAGTRACLGNVAIADRGVAFNQQINAITPQAGTDFRFIYALLAFGKTLVQAASTGGMKGLVSKSRFSAIRVIWPPKALQAAFGGLFEKHGETRSHLKLASQGDAELFATLVQCAFRGEITSAGAEQATQTTPRADHA